jgi:hypothetical protein
MTLASLLPVATASGNGVATIFSVPFKIFTANALVVYSIDNDPASATYREETLLTMGTDYSVSGVGLSAGCTVTFVTAPSSGVDLLFTSDTALEQATAYSGSAFPASAHENALDKAMRINQEQQLHIKRSLRFPLQDGDDVSPQLPPRDIRASKMFGFDADGDILMLDNIDPETVAALGDRIADLGVIAPVIEANAAAADASRIAAQAAQVAAESARDATLAVKPALESNISTLETGLMSLAMKQAVQAGDTDRSILMNGWLDPLADADEVTITNGSFVSADGGYLTNAGAEDHVTALDLTTAQFLDEKGGITTFTVDTANTSGHFDAAVGARIKAGCRMVIGGVSYPIASISGDGTAANSVVFSGTLAAGTYAVQAIHGTQVSGGKASLAVAMVDRTTTIVDRTLGTVLTFSSPSPGDLASAFDGITSQGADYSTRLCNPGPYQLGKDWGAGNQKRICKVDIYGTSDYGISYPAVTTFTMQLQGSNDLAAWNNLSAAVQKTNSAGGLFVLSPSDIIDKSPYQYHRVVFDNLVGTTPNYIAVAEMQFYEQTVSYPAGTIYPLSLSLDCTDWTAITALASTETRNGQNIWYALSFDGGTTYGAFVSGAWRLIVRNNAGTWQYRTGSIWAVSDINSALGAMAQAALGTGNRMNGATMAGLSQAQIEGSGGFTGGQTSLPVLVALYSVSTTATPVLSAMSMTSDIQPHDMVAEFNAFEAVDPDIGRAVFVMQAVDDITLDTDLKAWMKRGTGAYAQVPLVQDSAYDATRVLVRGELDMSATPGTTTQLKLTTHNNKVVRVFQAANYFKSK